MMRRFLSGISERNTRKSLFLFFGLLFLSVTFFVSADNSGSDKNIFQDSDQDGLSNDEEVLYKTDPLNKDTDGDGYMDGVEVESGYDPLKKAPGDKIVESTVSSGKVYNGSSDTNLTEQVSQEIANMMQDGALGQDEITLEDISASVQGILDQSNQEVILPEVDMSTIKIKLVSKSLKGSKREEQEREDAIEYLTVVSYILANNSPKKFHDEKDLSSVLTSLGTESLSAITLGNQKYLQELSEKGEKTLQEINDVEVPEKMLDVHVKAIKMVKYSMQLKEEVKTVGEGDPLGQIASLSKVQGFLGVATDFFQEITLKLNELDIKEIPIDL